MNKALDTYWTDSRLSAQRPLPRTGASIGLTETILNERAGQGSRSRTLNSPRGILLMVILAMSGLCVTATMRAHAEINEAALHYQQVSADVEALRNDNAALESEVARLRNDPRMIEMAARSRLGMLRPNEIVVTVK